MLTVLCSDTSNTVTALSSSFTPFVIRSSNPTAGLTLTARVSMQWPPPGLLSVLAVPHAWMTESFQCPPPGLFSVLAVQTAWMTESFQWSLPAISSVLPVKTAWMTESFQWPLPTISSVLAVKTAWMTESFQWPPPGLSSVLAVRTAWMTESFQRPLPAISSVLPVKIAWMTESFQWPPPGLLQPLQRRPDYNAFVTDTSASGGGGDASFLLRVLCLSKYVGIYDFRKLSRQMVWTAGILTHLFTDMSVHVAAATECTKICANWQPANSNGCDRSLRK